jgi:hypothetical protein
MIDVLTPKKFEAIIEDIVWKKDITYFEAVIWYCANNDIEIEVAAKLCNKNLKGFIGQEASELNMVNIEEDD